MSTQEIVPESSRVMVHPTTRQSSKRPSKSVRQRKRENRRVMLNKFTQERITKSFKINVVEIDGVEQDFADAFAFFTWYQENYVRLEDVPRPLALKFRKQYLALNISQEEDEWLKETILHKYLFDDCYYEKLENSDSDESVYGDSHKSDRMEVSGDGSVGASGHESPIYRAESPVYVHCSTTEYSGSSDESESPSVDQMSADRITVSTPEPLDTSIVMTIPGQSETVLFVDAGARRLCERMTAADYDEINAIKRRLFERKGDSNVKVRYGIVTLYLHVTNITCYHLPEDDPILTIDNRLWQVRQGTRVDPPAIIVRPKDTSIARVVAMG